MRRFARLRSASIQPCIAPCKLAMPFSETNLQNDQLQHRRYLQTSSGDEAKARAAVISSLEDCVNAEP